MALIKSIKLLLVKKDREDIRYCGILRRGSLVNGAGQPFETVLPIELPIIGNQLILNIKPFFEHTVNFQKVQRVMIPGRIAQWYCQELSEHFRSE